jgi:hypothetical protein
LGFAYGQRAWVGLRRPISTSRHNIMVRESICKKASLSTEILSPAHIA